MFRSAAGCWRDFDETIFLVFWIFLQDDFPLFPSIPITLKKQSQNTSFSLLRTKKRNARHISTRFSPPGQLSLCSPLSPPQVGAGCQRVIICNDALGDRVRGVPWETGQRACTAHPSLSVGLSPLSSRRLQQAHMRLGLADEVVLSSNCAAGAWLVWRRRWGRAGGRSRRTVKRRHVAESAHSAPQT